MKVKAVIGANFGDEGKGLMVDYFAANNPFPLIIRSNGGAQAGHTVTLSNGLRHVHSHFGSGTLAGYPSHLSKFFITNPYIFNKELKELNDIGRHPIITADQQCIVTTPFDMFLNQMLEVSRGDERHGSVGLGINATVERNKSISLTYDDLNTLSRSELDIKLFKIRKYVRKLLPKRTNYFLKLLYKVFNDDATIDKFIDDCYNMLKICKPLSIDVNRYETIIFEAGQGLLLDEEYGTFPYLTRSNCGMKNIAELIKDYNLVKSDIESVYVTRSYLTRHGVGPLANEQPMPEWVVDKTNYENFHQGRLRYAPLIVEEILSRADYDSRYGQQFENFRWHLAVTCLDQRLENLEELSVDEKEMLKFVVTKAEYCSYGPTRKYVVN